jgi:type IV pilus assembly protein PilM
MMNPSNLSKSKNTGRIFLCVDFGESFIKVVYLQNRQGAYTLLGHGLVEFGATQKNEQDVSHFLKQLLENNSIRAKEVAFSVSDPEGVFIRKLDLAQMPRAELLKAIKRQLEEELSIDPEENVWDFQVISEYTDSESRERIKLLCVFVKKDIINKYIQAVAACGLMPRRISTSAFNHEGTLATFLDPAQVSAILDIAGTHSDLAIYQNNKLNSVGDLEFSTEKLRAALVGILATRNERIEVNMQQAKELLSQHGIPPDPTMILERQIKGEDIILPIRPILERLVAQLRESFLRFKAENNLAVNRLYITGGGANLKNLDVYLAEQLKMKIDELPLPKSLNLGKVDVHKFSLEANQLSGVLGLGMASGGVNLLPAGIKTHKNRLRSLIEILVLVWLLVFITSIILIKMQKPLVDLNTFSPPASGGVLLPVSPAINLPVRSEPSDEFGPVNLKNAQGNAPVIAISEKNLVPEIVLTGIFWDKEKPLAIINGKVVGQGQSAGNKKVVEIKPDRVILSDGRNLSEIRLKERLQW